MSSLVHVTGIVLHVVKHGETSLIITAFTRELGKVGLMAKGARGKSKLGSAAGLELLTESQFVLYYKAGRDLQLLKEWMAVEPHRGLRENFNSLTIGSAVAEILSRCLREHDPHPELFDAARTILQALDGSPASPLPLLWAFQLHLFSVLGFGLRTEQCTSSGVPLTPPFSSTIGYRFADGAFLHPSVKNTVLHDGELSAEAFMILSRLTTSPLQFAARLNVSPRAQHDLTTFLARYLETHLPVSGKLRSLQALNWGRISPDSSEV
ncbi:DNA repair protein RecO [candidate division KSB1 bacterium]|nr:MAG: DNA repair protein RecO [candidate division KSB1 bacterium]